MSAKEQEQQSLFGISDEEWRDHWHDMPEFEQHNLEPYKSVLVHFKTREDMLDFMRLIDQEFTINTKFIYHPKNDRN